MSITDELSKAQAAHEAAQSKADQARDRAERAAAAHAEQVADRRRQAAERVLSDYDAAALAADVTTADRALRAAVEADPVWSAVADLAAAQGRRYARAVEAANAASTLGAPAPAMAAPATGVAVEQLLAIAVGIGANRAADEEDARAEAAEEAIQTGA